MLLPVQMIAASTLDGKNVQPITLSAQGEIHTWLIPITAFATAFASTIDALSEAEQQRALAMRMDIHRQRFQYCRAILRQMLSRYTGITAHEIIFNTAQYGKLHLSDQQNTQGIDFSVSHSADWLLLGFSTAGEIGVDIEQIREDMDFEAIAQHYFPASDNLAINLQAEATPSTRFFSCWTGKEAVSKVKGLGLQLDLSSFETLTSSGELRAQVSVSHPDGKTIDHYVVYPLPAPLDFSTTLARLDLNQDTLDIIAHQLYF